MLETMVFLSCLEQCTDKTTIRQLNRIVVAMLTMTGRVTMLGISRWTEGGGSYRTIQRFFAKSLPWGTMLWLVFRHHILRAEHEYIGAGDETIVTKAGKETHGLDRFYSSIYGKPVPGLAFFALSLISVEERRSYPILVEQRTRSGEEKQAAQAKAKGKKASQKKGKAGRPKGSKSKDKRQIEWTPELLFIRDMLEKLVLLLLNSLSISYLVLDGHFGNNHALQMVRQFTPWHLISKLRHDAALYFLYDGPQQQFGARRRYGAKIDYQNIPDKYLVATSEEDQIRTLIYQATMLHKCFAQSLNIVIIVKINLVTGARGHVVLFSSNLALHYAKLIDYYVLRFQLEFNFRDAKQFWGLEDFMNIRQIPITNAVNLSFFLVSLSQFLLASLRQEVPKAGILDLKAFFLGRRYALETLNLLPEPPTSFISAQIVRIVASLGTIHRQPAASLNP